MAEIDRSHDFLQGQINAIRVSSELTLVALLSLYKSLEKAKLLPDGTSQNLRSSTRNAIRTARSNLESVDEAETVLKGFDDAVPKSIF